MGDLQPHRQGDPKMLQEMGWGWPPFIAISEIRQALIAIREKGRLSIGLEFITRGGSVIG